MRILRTMVTITVRRLVPGDDAMIEALLAITPETTIFLRSNLSRAALVDDGAPFSGTYAGVFEDDRLVGLAGHAHLADTAETRKIQGASLAQYQDNGHHWVLTVDGERVSYSAFNATIGDVVQVGGVWTPPQHRGRGYARCVVAGSLRDARNSGLTRAVLFTSEANVPAQKAYAAIGFRAIGDYGIVFFA